MSDQARAELLVCEGYENGCRCDDCLFIDIDDSRSNGFITWDEA